MRLVDLLSDTVTKPSLEMRTFMLNAEVGDDVFGEDPSVNALQKYAADLFGRESALFCVSGTMTNQIAIQLFTKGLSEVICEEGAHIYQYECGGYAHNARTGLNLVHGQSGKITAEQVEASIKPSYDWFPKTTLVALENTTNKGGGSYYTLEEIKSIWQVCKKREIALHLDGARLFNALAATGEKAKDWGQYFNTISICLSKGLGAPVGSLLIGDTDTIKEARRYRKVMGGGMRQAGIIAAGGLYALQNNVARLSEDHRRAKVLGACLESLPFVIQLKPIRTNIVIFDLRDDVPAQHFVDQLLKNNIRCFAISPSSVRMVTHLDFNDSMLDHTIEVFEKLKF